MHIIVLELEPTSLRGGQEVVLFDICRGLAQRGYSISLIYTKEGNLLEKYQQFCEHLVKVDRFMIYPPRYILDFLTDLRKINQNIPISENTLVLTNQYQDTFLGRVLALSNKIPFVCYLHLPPPEKPTGLKDLKQVVAVAYIRWQWNFGLKGVNKFISVSSQTKSDWVNRGYKEDKIDVVYNGIELEVYKPPRDFSLIRKKWNISENIRVISYVGRLDQEKGLETLIKAFASLLKSGANAKLLIAGKPLLQSEEYKKSLEQLATDLGVEKHVDFLGHVNNTTSVYQVSDVTVLASLWSEPFPRSIIEAMACGTPVVASRTGGIPESLTGEFQNELFDPGNEQDLLDALNQTINWRDQDPQLGKRCREHALSKFSFDRMVDGIEKVLEHLNPPFM